ncbi:hypothetical protein LFM09_39880 [Lentzea alba]|uniref:hypothetical protein n=1 Tax=Lentzea alba TaxID=2714351 RepID=UPI0039BED92E
MRIAVVDGFSMSRVLVQELAQRGAECVHVCTRPDFGEFHTRLFDASVYAADLGYAADARAAAEALRPLGVDAVIPGAESGVILADQIADAMGLVPTVNDSPYDVGIEMLFDAAQCLRFGRDILVNIATDNHRLAVEWLERHLEGRYTLHRMHRVTDSHNDSVVLPLRPGTLLIRSRQYLDHLPAALQKWDVIEAPEPNTQNFPQYDEDDVILTSPFIDLNVLSIDERTVMINDSCPELGRVLEQHGFDVVPVRHRHRRLFGGGLHCFTLDTVRDGGLEDYLS